MFYHFGYNSSSADELHTLKTHLSLRNRQSRRGQPHLIGHQTKALTAHLQKPSAFELSEE